MAYIEHRQQGGNESWRVCWRETGRKQQQTFYDAEVAENFRLFVEGSGNRWPRGWIRGKGWADDQDSHAPLFRDWAEEAITARRRASDRTKADYRRDLTKHVYPHVGDVPVDLITDKHVSKWVDALVASGLAAKTISNIQGMVSSIIDDARTHRPPLVDHNVFASCLDNLPGVRTEEMVFLTPAEFDTVLAAIPDWYRPLAQLLFGTGLRFGEATALRVRDLDLLGTRPTLTVVRAWKRQPDQTYKTGEPKTRRSRRTISLSPQLVDILLPLAAGKRGTELVITSANGHQMLGATFHDVAWAPAVARARVCDMHFAEQVAAKTVKRRKPQPCTCPGVLDKKPRVHDLRHSHASWLISEGHPLLAVSRRLGHASITTTADRYGHLMPDLDDAINASIDRALTRH
jgi:integrase